MSEQTASEKLYVVSSSPHIYTEDSVASMMWHVNLALLPACIFSVIYFGLPALITLVASCITAVITEYAIQRLRNKPVTISDGSAVLTGLLMAMCLPAKLPVYMTVFGAFFAIAIAKHAMGGLGYNIFNPAHIGRAILMVSWPLSMTAFTDTKASVDALTSATPLNVLKSSGYEHLISLYGSPQALYEALLFGTRNGSLGETSSILLFMGGLYLLYRRIIRWEVPVVMIATVGLITWVFGPSGFFTGDPILHMLSGGLMIGAFFMATDMVTIPITSKGKILFAIGAGLLTSLIRLKGGYPEGVCYAILLMNALTPLIDRYIQPSPFGTRR